MKIEFDRQDYLALEEIFEVGQLDDVTLELSEFSDDIEDMAYELAYTRYELAKAEARHTALREAVAWEREVDELIGLIPNFWEDDNIAGAAAIRSHSAAHAEVDRLIANEASTDCKGEG